MGLGNILLDGVRFQKSKSTSYSKNNQENEFQFFSEEYHRQKLEGILSESRFNSVMIKPANKGDLLKQEILDLEEQLQTQFKLRKAFESCLDHSCPSSLEDEIDTTSLPEDAAGLIRDITALELEVAQLEECFLSLNQKAFNQVPLTFPSSENCTAEKNSQPGVSRDYCIISKQKLQRHSSLLRISKSSLQDIHTESTRYSDSMSMSMTDSQSGVSLAKHLGTRFADLLPETPNRLSEDMIQCMTTIYCKLSKAPLTHIDLSQSQDSSTSTCGSQYSSNDDYNNMWSPALSFEDVKLENPYNVEGVQETNGPYSTLVEVPSIFTDDRKLVDVEDLMQEYRSIIYRLEEVDPTKLTHEEKLAFWINIHNSLVMNAFLAYGIPHSNPKRALCIHKAAYNIGGHSINAETIESTILGCRMSRPGQWIKKLYPSRSAHKTGDGIQAYAIEKPEPLLYFTLSSGSFSDPAVVHAYTPSNIFHEMETAKNEYISATLGIIKNRKIILPKLVESFLKDSRVSSDNVLKTILQSLPRSLRRNIKKSLSSNKSPKIIEWIPHNFSFRYLISKELAKYSVTRRSKTHYL